MRIKEKETEWAYLNKNDRREKMKYFLAFLFNKIIFFQSIRDYRKLKWNSKCGGYEWLKMLFL